MLLEFERKNGRAVFINPHLVAYVAAAVGTSEGGTVIAFSARENNYVTVNEGVDLVQGQISSSLRGR